MSPREHLQPAARTGRRVGPPATAPTRPPGLLEKLLGVLRPEFRGDDLVFDPRDRVFGGLACAVGGCEHPARSNRMCWGHRVRWDFAGKPDLSAFLATTSPEWVGHRPVASCGVPGCRFGLHSRRMCQRHIRDAPRTPGPDRLARLRGPAAVPVAAPAGLPDHLLRLVGAGHVDVLRQP